jgi:hypothetical protein
MTAISLFLIALLFLYPTTNSINLLLIGDSVDRYITEDWCNFIKNHPNGKKEDVWRQQWADGSIRYNGARGSRVPLYICGSYDTNDSIAFVHHFGSNPRGPYDHGWISSPEDPFVDSEPRIRHALKIYYKKFPPPDRIIYQSVLWDLKIQKEGSEIPLSLLWNESLTEFECNINQRLSDIINLANNLTNGMGFNTTVGLRTAVHNPSHSTHPKGIGGNALLLEYNNIIRRICRVRNLILYDFDYDAWASVNWNPRREKEILRDVIHPNVLYVVNAAEKMLNRIYTSFLTDHIGGTELGWERNVPRIWMGKGLRPSREMEVFLISDKHNKVNTMNLTNMCRTNWELCAPSFAIETELFLIFPSDIGGYLRYKNISEKLLNLLHLSFGDIYYASSQEIEYVPLVADLPLVITRGEGVVNTTSGKLYLIRDNDCREFEEDYYLMSTLNISLKSVTYAADDFMVNRISKLSSKGPIMNIYRDNTLVRFIYSKEIFLIVNGTRHSVSSSIVFTAHKWKFSDVKILAELSDLESINVGEAVTE